MNIASLVGAIGTWIISSVAVSAATLIIDSDGQLTGASDVDVGGTLFDVEFLQGSCATIYDGCDEVSDFAFSSQSDAAIAANALLNQVFLGEFDDFPEKTFGCTSTVQCNAIIPYGFLSTGVFAGVSAVNNSLASGFTDYAFVNSGGGINTVYGSGTNMIARFSVAVVPLPASLPFLVAGLGGLAMIRRRRRIS